MTVKIKKNKKRTLNKKIHTTAILHHT